MRLERVLKTEREFWINAQRAYDTWEEGIKIQKLPIEI